MLHSTNQSSLDTISDIEATRKRLGSITSLAASETVQDEYIAEIVTEATLILILSIRSEAEYDCYVNIGTFP